MLIEINKITLTEPLDATGSVLVLAELVLPRNAIQSKRAFCQVDLKKGRRAFARAPFYEKALLKEKVEGRFGLKVSVTRPMSGSALGRLLRQLAATALESGVDSLAANLNLPFAALRFLPDVIEEAGEQLADRLADDAPIFIATGGIDLDSDNLQPGTLNIPLKLTETFRSAADLPLSERRAHRKSKATTYRKGSAIGAIQLQIEL